MTAELRNMTEDLRKNWLKIEAETDRPITLAKISNLFFLNRGLFKSVCLEKQDHVN